jgi:hypothetical protein
MRLRKLSELPDFAGKKLLLESENRGAKICAGMGMNAEPLILIGLADILVGNIIRVRDCLKKLHHYAESAHDTSGEFFDYETMRETSKLIAEIDAIVEKGKS